MLRKYFSKLKWGGLNFNYRIWKLSNEKSTCQSNYNVQYLFRMQTMLWMILLCFIWAYLVSIRKCVTGALRGSCEWAHDRFIERDVKLVINGRSGASGTSIKWREREKNTHLLWLGISFSLLLIINVVNSLEYFSWQCRVFVWPSFNEMFRYDSIKQQPDELLMLNANESGCWSS